MRWVLLKRSPFLSFSGCSPKDRHAGCISCKKPSLTSPRWGARLTGFSAVVRPLPENRARALYGLDYQFTEMSLTDPIAITVMTASCLGAAVSAAFAFGGGFVLLAVSAAVLPIEAVVPLQAIMRLNRRQIAATIAGSMLSMQVAKVAGYATFGFDFTPYTLLVVGCWLVAIPGTWFGKRFLHLISEQTFRSGFKILVTLLALRLLYRAWL